MKVEFISRSEEEVENYNYRNAVKILVDGKSKAKFYDGEPEDANLMRDFSDVFSIPSLMEMAYEAGKNGEEFEIEGIGPHVLMSKNI